MYDRKRLLSSFFGSNFSQNLKIFEFIDYVIIGKKSNIRPVNVRECEKEFVDQVISLVGVWANFFDQFSQYFLNLKH